ncbi:ABC-type glycerol-3-phosphate transport system substrate-binding protein [Bradyrhizobium niftali]
MGEVDFTKEGHAKQVKKREGIAVKQHDHDQHSAFQPNRRTVLRGAASAAALGTSGALGTFSELALAQANLRAQITQVPGVGKGAPTDADWQKVGELCLGPTKASIKEGEFKGVELSFMGLNNQNLHNLLFRGFLKPWEAYTGAKISWIDLAQADYNPRLQQAIATSTVDFDILEMGAPFEGDVCGKASHRRCRTGSKSKSISMTMSTI